MESTETDSAEKPIDNIIKKLKGFVISDLSYLLDKFTEAPVLASLSLFEDFDGHYVKELIHIENKQELVISSIISFHKFLKDASLKNEATNEHHFKMCKTFVKYCFKALQVFEVPVVLKDSKKLEHKMAVEWLHRNFSTRGKAARQFFISVILNLIPVSRLLQIFSHILHDLINPERTSAAVKSVKLILKEERILLSFSTATFKHLYYQLCSKESLDKRTSEESLLYISLIESVFLNLMKYPKVLIRLNKYIFPNIIQVSIKQISASQDPLIYLHFFKGIFCVQQNAQTFSTFESYATCIMDAFAMWLHSPLESQTWELLLISFFDVLRAYKELSKSFKDIIIEKRICLIIKAVIYSLNSGKNNLVYKSLECMSLLISNYASQIYRDLKLCSKTDLLIALYKTMRNSSTNNKFHAFFILGKLGPHNRDIFLEPQRLDTLDFEEPYIFISFENTEKCIKLPFTYIINTAFKALFSSEMDTLFDLRGIFNIVITFLSSFYVPMLQQRNFAFLEKNLYQINNLDVIHTVKTALICMFICNESGYIDNGDQGYVEIFIKEYIDTVRKIPTEILKNYINLLTVLFDASIEVMCLYNAELKLYSADSFVTVLNVAFLTSESHETWNNSFLVYLITKIKLLCQDTTIERVLAGTKLISLILEGNFQILLKCKYKNLPEFLVILINSICNFKGKISFGLIEISRNLIKKVLLKYCSEMSFDVKCDLIAQSIIKILFDRIISKSSSMRKEARRCLKIIYNARECSLADLINPINPNKLDYLTQWESLKLNVFLTLYEDFEFAKKLQLPNNNSIKFIILDIFNQLKACNQDFKTKSVINTVKKVCSALIAITFNCENRIDISNIMQVLFSFTRQNSVVINITCFRCMDYILTKYGTTEIRKKAEKFMVPDVSALRYFFILTETQMLRFIFFIQTLSDDKKFKYLLYLVALIERSRDYINSLHEKECCKMSKRLNKLYVILGILNFYDYAVPKVIRCILRLTFEMKNCWRKTTIETLKDSVLTYCKKFPKCTIEYFLYFSSDPNNVNDFMKLFLDGQDGLIYIKILQKLPSAILMSHLGLVHWLAKKDEVWLMQRGDILDSLLTEFLLNYSCESILRVDRQKYLTHCLLEYYKSNIFRFDVLFPLLTVLSCPFSDDFHFLKSFLSKIVTIENVGFGIHNGKYWKAEMFLYFEKYLKNTQILSHIPDILKYLIVPSFVDAFNKNEGIALLRYGHKYRNVLQAFLECAMWVDEQFHKDSKTQIIFNKIKLFLLNISSVISLRALEVMEAQKKLYMFSKYSKIMEIKRKEIRNSEYFNKERIFYPIYLFLSAVSLKNDIIKNLAKYENKNSFASQVLDMFLVVNHFKEVILYVEKNIHNCKLCVQELINIANLLVQHYKVLYPASNLLINLMLLLLDLLGIQKTYSECMLTLNVIEIILDWGSFNPDKIKHRENAQQVMQKVFNTILTIACYNSVSYPAQQDILYIKCKALLQNDSLLLAFSEYHVKFDNSLFQIIYSLSDVDMQAKGFSLLIDLIMSFRPDTHYLIVISFTYGLSFIATRLMKFEDNTILENICSLLSMLFSSKESYANISLLRTVLQNTLHSLPKQIRKCVLCLLLNSLGEDNFISPEVFHAESLEFLNILLNMCLEFPNLNLISDALNCALDLVPNQWRVDLPLMDKVVKAALSIVPNCKPLTLQKIMKLMIIFSDALCINVLNTSKEIEEDIQNILFNINAIFYYIHKRIATAFKVPQTSVHQIEQTFLQCYLYFFSNSENFGIYADKDFQRVPDKLLWKSCYCFEKSSPIFSFLVQKSNNNLYTVFKTIIEMLKFPMFSSKQCIHFIYYIIKDVSFGENFNSNNNLKDIFHAIAQLCEIDECLAEYMWIYIAAGIWKLFSIEQKQELYTEICKMVNSDHLPRKAEMILVTLLGCIHNSDFKRNDIPENRTLDLILSINIKSLNESLKMKLICSQILQSALCKGTVQFPRTREYVTLLNNMYEYMDEHVLFYCFNQNFACHNAETVEAIELQRKRDPAAASAMYNKAKSRLEPHVYNHEFCREASKRCAQEQIIWNKNRKGLSLSIAFTLLKYIWSKSKTTVLLEAPKNQNKEYPRAEIKDFFLKLSHTYMNEEKQKYPFTKSEELLIIRAWIYQWKILPETFMSSNHYSLLQLIQQIAEMKDISVVIQELKNGNVESVRKVVRRFISDCKSKNYLLSDNLFFIIELINLRLLIYRESYQFCCHYLRMLEVLRCLKFETKRTLIDLYIVAIINGKHLNSLNSSIFAIQDANCIKSVLSSLVFHANKLPLHAKKGYVLSASQYLSKCQDWIEKATFSEEKEKQDIAKECKNFSKFLKLCNGKHRRNEKEMTVIYLNQLFQASVTGNNLMKLKFVAKLLWFLQCEGGEALILEYLKKHHREIPAAYWIKFVPILVLYYFQCKSSLGESIMHHIEKIIINVEKSYPEEVMFSFLNYKNGWISENGDKKNKERWEHYWSGFKKRNPDLISHFEEIIQDLISLKSNPEEYYYHKLSIILQKAKSSFIFHSERQYYSTTLKDKILKDCKIMSQCTLKVKDSEVVADKNTLEEFVDALSVVKEKYAQSCRKRLQSRPIFLDEFCQFIQNWTTEGCKNMKIFPYYQLSEMDNHTTIEKFETKVSVIEWNDCFAYKINVIGKNGKVYSYLLMDNDLPEEMAKSDILMAFVNILNEIFFEDVECAQSFAQYHVPRTLLISPRLKLVSFIDTCTLLCKEDIVSQSDSDTFSLEQYECLVQRDHSKDYLENIDRFHRLKYIPRNMSIVDMNIFMEHYIFKKKQFLQSVSLLVSAEYLLNLTTCRKIMIHRDSGMIIPETFHVIDPNFKDPAHLCPTVLEMSEVQNILGDLELHLIVENMMNIQHCLQENYKLISPLVHIFYNCSEFKMFTNTTQQEALDLIHRFMTKRRGLEKSDIFHILKKKFSYCDSR